MNVRLAALCVACLIVTGTGRVSATFTSTTTSTNTEDVRVTPIAELLASRPVGRPATAARQSREAPAVGRPWWGWVLLGRLHPLVVHFPIGLLTVAAVIEAAHLLRRRPVPSEAATWCLALGVAGAAVSIFFGTLNAAHQTITGDAALTLERHRMLGWIAVVAATAALGAGQFARRAAQVRTTVVYVGLVLVTSAVVGATGHLGGEMVYGSEYLTGALPWNQATLPTYARTAAAVVPGPAAAVPAPTGERSVAAPAPASAPGPRPSVANRAADGGTTMPATAPAAPMAAHEEATAFEVQSSVDFARDVKPIIDQTCVECHGPEKVKARLRMDSVEGLQKGGKSGALLKPGDPENSLILRRVLGLDGEDQMPLDKDPLSEAQIDTLRRWIAAGASYGAGGSQ